MAKQQETISSLPAKEPAERQRTIRSLIFLEARKPTTGPVKNAVQFALRAARTSHPLSRVHPAIVTFHRMGWPAPNELTSFCSQRGLETHVIEERSALDPYVLRAMRRLVESYRPNIIETHSVKSHFLVWLTQSYRHSVWIAFHHGYTWTDTKMRLYNRLDNWSLRCASAVMTDCIPFAEDLSRIGVSQERISVLHSSVDRFATPAADLLSALRRNLYIPDESVVILSVGRLSKEKGQRDLIEAVALLPINPGVCVILAGDGPDREMLLRHAAHLGVTDRFRFVGHVDNITPYYGLAHMVVVPSHSEGSPNVVLEAMAAGIPIIATSVGGVPEIVRDHREGLLVPSRDPRALAQSIDQLLKDTSLTRQLASQAQLRSEAYSPDAYCQSLLATYLRCLDSQDWRVGQPAGTK